MMTNDVQELTTVDRRWIARSLAEARARLQSAGPSERESREALEEVANLLGATVHASLDNLVLARAVSDIWAMADGYLLATCQLDEIAMRADLGAEVLQRGRIRIADELSSVLDRMLRLPR
jgi:hypothetical protein